MRRLLVCAAFLVGCVGVEGPQPETAEPQSTPTSVETFDEQKKPPQPDYTVQSSWAAHPDATGPDATVPEGASTFETGTSVDVFYIHPTTFRTQTNWNQDVSDTKTNDWTDASVIARQASVFNECCRIFAPRYRQASFLATRDRLLEADGGKAYALAYSDIRTAFEYFLENENNGRPFIIAGHSQGALMTYWLLRDYVDGKELEDRLVAAYTIGVDLVEGDFGRTFSSLNLCQKPSQTGCILAWNAGDQSLDLDLMSQLVGGRYARVYGTQEGRVAVCVNPITFDAELPKSTQAMAKGAVIGAPDGSPVGALKAKAVSAECKRGFLVVNYDESLSIEPLPGGSLHYHEYGLFYQDIRANVRRRIEAFSE